MEEAELWIPQKLDIDKTSYTAEEFYEWFRSGRLVLKKIQQN